MEADQLIESFEFRFAAAGVRKPKRVSEELLAYVFGCRPPDLHSGDFPVPAVLPEKFAIIRKLEELAVRIENGEEPQAVIGCVDF